MAVVWGRWACSALGDITSGAPGALPMSAPRASPWPWGPPDLHRELWGWDRAGSEGLGLPGGPEPGRAVSEVTGGRPVLCKYRCCNTGA